VRILLVTHGYPPELGAGTERTVERLARELLVKGHEVGVVTGSFEPRPKVEVARRVQDGVKIFTIHRSDLYFDRWEKTYCPEASDAFAKILAEVKPDVVHVHQFIRLSRDLVHRCVEARVPSVMTHHDFTTTCLIGFRAPGAGEKFCDVVPRYEDCVPCAGTVMLRDGTPAPGVPLAGRDEFALLRDDFRNELELANARCAVSRAQREKLARYHGVPEEFFEIVPLALLFVATPGTPAPEPPPLRVATWGMQMARKGAHVLLEAARIVGPAVEVDVFGRFDNAAYEKRCRGLARDLPVRFHGAYEWAELAATRLHAAVFPSLTFETFGLTFDEAWALGHPVIATDLGAYRERAENEARLFPPGDAAALAAILRQLLDKPGELARWRATTRAAEGFSRYVRDMEAIYARVLTEGAKPPDRDRFDRARHPSAAEFEAREERFRRQLSSSS
jgi:glycosyltransferase involved in cell wall biosynthesis